jgi:hypothetical protein
MMVRRSWTKREIREDKKHDDLAEMAGIKLIDAKSQKEMAVLIRRFVDKYGPTEDRDFISRIGPLLKNKREVPDWEYNVAFAFLLGKSKTKTLKYGTKIKGHTFWDKV